MSGSQRVILNVGRQNSILHVRGLVLKHAGFRVIDVTDPLEAIEIAGSRNVDLVLFCHTIPPRKLRDMVSQIEKLSASTQLAFVLRNEFDEAPYALEGIPNNGEDLVLGIHNILDPSAEASAPIIA